jgi:PHP family Zn ribbon phosphoesterase
MEFIADFHIHSKYSRATSRNMDIEHIAEWAKLKGVTLMGTGDFTHHLWLEELKANLEDLGNGLFKYQDIYFILTVEISSIYSKNGRGYRVHNVIFAPSFKTVDKINNTLSHWGNIASDGRPILGIDAAELARMVFDIDENCFFVPAHIWTPWFSVFGSMSGFDKIEACFEEQTSKIFALETGLSSDPAMNWRWSCLDRFSLISNSDSHSPSRIGREANVFNCPLSYKDIIDKALTIGVMNRVEQLSDRPEGFKPKNAVPYKNLIPLDEIIAEAKAVGKSSKAVEGEYRMAISKFGTEFEILLRAKKEELEKNLPQRIAEGVLRVRKGQVIVQPGFDGEYGKISTFSDKEKQLRDEQLSLF